MEPGGTLEERAEVTRKRILDYTKFRLGEDKLLYELGAKERKPHVPSAGEWNITYVDPQSAVDRFSHIRDSVMEERVEKSQIRERRDPYANSVASLLATHDDDDEEEWLGGGVVPNIGGIGGSSILSGASLREGANDAISTLEAHSSIVGQPAAALLRASGRTRRNNQNKAVAKFLHKPAIHTYGVAKPHGYIPKKDKLVRQRPRLLPGMKESHSVSAPALLSVNTSTSRLRELVDTLPYKREPVKLDGAEKIRRLRHRGNAYARDSPMKQSVSDPKSTMAWEGDPEAGDIVGTVEPVFIPVELFDDPNLEPWPVAEWLERGERNEQGFVLGHSRYYDLEGAWDWKLCEVLEYVSGSSRFLIRWSHSRKKKYVPRVNLRFLGEDEDKFDRRFAQAQERRDTAEAAARYKGAIQALLDEVDLPKVVVPSEIFIGIFSRSNVDIEAPMARTLARSIAKLSEEVRLDYIAIMNRLHAAAIVVAPVPGHSTEMKGMPELPYESQGIRTLRHGGFLEWKRICGLHSDEALSFEDTRKATVEYLPIANPYVLKTMQRVREEIIHRVKAMDALWGPGTKWKPEAAFNLAYFNLLPDDKKSTHKFRFYLEEGHDVATDGKCLGRYPSNLGDFVSTQMTQIKEFKNVAIPHAAKVLDDLVFDGYSVACDELTAKLSKYEAALQDQRTRRSAPPAVLPILPEGIVEPKELSRMRIPGATVKDIPPGIFANREASIISSEMYRGPFRRALYILNHMFLDTLRDSVLSGVENLVGLFSQYNVTPIDPTIEAFGRALAAGRRKKKKKGSKKKKTKVSTQRSGSTNINLSPKATKAKKLATTKWNMAGKKMTMKIRQGVPVVGGTVGVPYSTCQMHVDEVNDAIKFQGYVARSTDVLTDASAYLVNTLKEPLLKVTLSLSHKGKTCLCEFSPPLHEFETGMKSIITAVVDIGIDVVPINIDILQPTDNASERDHRGHFFSHTRSATGQHEAFVMNRSRTLMSLLRGNMAFLGSLVLAMQTFKDYFELDMGSYVDIFRESITDGSRTGVLKAQVKQIDFLESEADRIRHTLVDTLWLNAFEVDCKQFKNEILGNVQAMRNLLLRRIDSDLRDYCQVMAKRFGEYYQSLSIWPKNIEEFDILKASLDDFQRLHPESITAVESLEHQLNALENRKFGISERDYDRYWEARGWPYKLQSAHSSVIASLKQFQKRFEEELRHQKLVFKEEIERLTVDYNTIHEKGVAQWRESEAVCDEISLLEDRLDGAVEEAELIRSREEILGWDHGEFGQASEMRAGMKPFNELWSKLLLWERQLPEWMDGPFMNLDSEATSEFVRQCWRDMFRLQKIFDQHAKFEEPLKVADRLKGALEGFKQYLPLIRELRNPAMRARHWMDLSTEMGTTLRVDNSLTLRRLLADNMLDHQESIQDISRVASHELKIEIALHDMEAAWNVSGSNPAEVDQQSTPIIVNFVLLDGIGTYGISNIAEITDVLDEHAVTLQELEDSVYAAPFAKDITRLKRLHSHMQDLFENWIVLQQTYVSLYPQFLSGLLAKIPEAPAQFQSIDEQWRNTIDQLRTKDVKFSPPAMRFVDSDDILEVVISSKATAETILRNTDKYLANMRKLCSRLYLLSNTQLLRLLSVSRNPVHLKPLLRILFAGIDHFELAKWVKIETVEDEMESEYSESGSEYTGSEYEEGEESEESEAESVYKVVFREELEVIDINNEQFGKAMNVCITGCIGLHDERLMFGEEVALCDKKSKKMFSAEEWINPLVSRMQQTLLSCIEDQVKGSDLQELWEDMLENDEGHYNASVKHLEAWLKTTQVQVGLVSRTIQHSHCMERVLRSGERNGLHRVRDGLLKEIRCTTDVLRKSPIRTVAENKNSTLFPFHSASTHILALVGFKDSVVHLIKNNIETVGGFDFQATFRQVMTEGSPRSPKKLNVNMGILATHKYRRSSISDGTLAKKPPKYGPMMERGLRVECRMLGFRRHHSLEYYGICSRIVVTPLCERYQRCMFAAMRYCVSAVSLGEAGWGKTESVKDTAFLIGTMFLTYKLSSATTMNDLRSILSATCANGAWCSIDNFCSVGKGILALLAETIGPLQKEAVSGAGTANLAGRICKLSFGWGLSFSLTPRLIRDIGIPPSLRTLLRITQFHAPNSQYIMEILLVSCGFIDANGLSAKVMKFLTKATLAFPSRKDIFGLRQFKSTLFRICYNGAKADICAGEQEVLLFNSLLRTLKLQLCNDDQYTLEDIVLEIVPSLHLEEKNPVGANQTLDIRSVEKCMDRHYFTCADENLLVFKGLYDSISVQSNVIIVGQAGSGKSTYINILAEAMSEFERAPFGTVVPLADVQEGKKLKKTDSKTPTGKSELDSSSDSEQSESEEEASSSDSEGPTLAYGKERRGQVHIQFINPTSMTFDEFFGAFDGQKWIPGIFFSFATRFSENCSGYGGIHELRPYQRKWLILDSPLKQKWLEIVSACLDERRELLSANGDRVIFNESMSLIFETDDLSSASPSFLSHCGIISTDNSSDWENLVDSWISNAQIRIPTLRPYFGVLQGLCGSLLLPCLEYTMGSQHGEMANNGVLRNSVWIVSSFFRLFECNLRDFKPSSSAEVLRVLKSKAKNGGAKRVSAKLIDSIRKAKVMSMHAELIISDLQNVFLESLLWSLNAYFSKEGQKRLDAHVREILSNLEKSDEKVSSAAGGVRSWKYIRAQAFMKEIPREGLISNYIYNSEIQQWQAWDSHGGFSKPIDDSIKTTDIFQRGHIIPTIDFTRSKACVLKLINAGNNVLLCGELSTGKKRIIQYAIGELPEDAFSHQLFSFRRGTISETLKMGIDELLVTKRKGTREPRNKKSLVVEMVDISAPRLEEEVRSVHELIRTLVGKGFWFSKYRGYYEATSIHNVRFVGSQKYKPTECSLSVRLLRHFNLVTTDPWNVEKMKCVLTAMTSTFMNRTNHRLSPVSSMLVEEVLALIETCRKEFLPSPQHPQYVFGYNDAARILYGVFRISSRSLKYSGPPQKSRLFIHEMQRVLEDRMLLKNDIQKLRNIIHQTVMNTFGKALEVGEDDSLTSQYWPQSFHMAVEFDRKPCLFTDLIGKDGYIEMTQLTKIQESIKDACERWNKTAEKLSQPRLNIIPFKFTVSHLLRATRTLSGTRDHLLLTGQPSTGKHTVLMMAAELLHFSYVDMDIAQLLSQNGGWRTALKKTLVSAAKGERILLVISLNCSAPKILEDLYTVLKPCSFLDIFSKGETEMLVMEFREKAVAAKTMITEELSDAHVMEYFVEKCTENLKISICTNGTKQYFEMWNHHKNLMQLFVIDNYENWDSDTLQYAAEEIFKGASTAQLDQKTISSVSQCAIAIHKTVETAARNRNLAMSQKDFLGMCYLYRKFTDIFFENSVDTKNKYEFALGKLSETEVEVATMKEEVAGMKPLLDRKVEIADTVMKTVSAERNIVTAHIRAVKDDEADIARQTAAAGEKRDHIKRILAQAMPVLKDAIAAVKNLSKSDIEEVKAMVRPPEKVKDVMEAVCIMLGLPPRKVADTNNPGKKIDDYWASSIAILGNPRSLLVSLEQYHDHHDIKEKIIERIESDYMLRPFFNPEEVRKASVACEGLCKWCIGITHYYRARQGVKPIQKALKEAEDELMFNKQVLEQKQKNVAAAEKRLAQLEKQLNRATNEKKSLQGEVQELSTKIREATEMVLRLETERQRWENALAELSVGNETIPSDSLLSAAYVAYCGPFSADMRHTLFTKWGEIIMESKFLTSTMGGTANEDETFSPFKFDPKRILTEEETMLGWFSTGLPNDNGNVGSATILQESMKKKSWPLVIDPDGYALYWMKNYFEATTAPIVVSCSSAMLAENVKKGLMQGRTVIVDLGTGVSIARDFLPLLALEEDMDESEGQDEARTMNVMYNGEQVDIEKGFQLVFVTKSALSEGESSSQPAILFSMSEEALRDEIIWILSYELFPEEAGNRQQCIIDKTKLCIQKKKLQNEVLELLNESEGSMMEDERLVHTMNDSRRKTLDCLGMLKVTEAKRLSSCECMDAFQPIAERAVLLYKILSNMKLVSNAYMFSMLWFISLLLGVIRDDDGLVVQEEESAVDDHTGAPKKKKKEKVVPRIASAFSLMIESHTVSKADYLAKKKATSKAEEEKKSQDTLSPSEANGSTGKESSADDEGEDTETFYIRQRRKIKEAIDTLTSRVVKIGGSGIFLQDHVAFVSAICLELLGFDWEERTLLSRRVGCIEQRELCDIVSRKEDIFMPSLFPCEAVDIDEFPIPKSVQSWMSAEQWGRILEVSKLDVFANLPLNIKNSAPEYTKLWRTIMDSAVPMSEEFPPPWNATLGLKDKVLLLRALCPNAYTSSVLPHLISAVLGPETLDSIQQDLKEAYNLSSMTLPAAPILLTLEPGGSKDPLSSIEEFYARWQRFYGGPKEPVRIFLGDGDTKKAAEELVSATSNGNWVILCNCHLEEDWLPHLDAIVHDYLHKKASDVNPRFRLWMISVVTEQFPAYLSEQSICSAVSEIHSIRHTVLSKFQNITPPDFDVDIMYSVSACDGDEPILQNIFPQGEDRKFDDAMKSAFAEPASSQRKKHFRLFTYGLALFHGILEQRASYGVLGWEDAFIEADLNLAKENLAIHMRRWEVLAHTREIKIIAETDGPVPPAPPAYLVDVDYDFFAWCRGTITDILFGNSLSDGTDAAVVAEILRSILCVDALKEGSPYEWNMDGDMGHAFAIGTEVELKATAGKKKSRKKRNEDPLEGTIKALDRYKEHVQNLPYSSPAEIVGLGPNATQEYTRLELKRTAASLSVLLFPQSTVLRPPTSYRTLLMQLEVLDELPDGCDGIYGMFAGAGESVVNREIILLNDLLAKFKLFLTSLRGALEGRIHWNQTHDSAIKSIKDGFFPEIWLGSFAHCYTQAGRRKAPISFWLNHMKQRVNYFNNILISQNFVGDVRLGYMLHPAFAIHSLVSDEHQCWGVCGVSTPAPPESIVFNGLYLDGAEYKSGLASEIAKNALFSSMSGIYVTKGKSKLLPEGKEIYTCPLYVTSDRDRQGGGTTLKLLEIPLLCSESNLSAATLRKRGVSACAYIHPDETFVKK